MSYGNAPQTFDFANGIDVISAPNGNGKSVLADVLSYSLFGKPFRKVKLGSLVNNINNKNLEVTLIFEIADKTYKVFRGMKPNIFEIYSLSDTDVWHLIDQEATTKEYQLMLEETILGFNDTVFRQLIVLGANVSNAKNFMDLNSTEKEEVFQIVTDTSLFKHLNDLIKIKRNELKTKITESEYQFDIITRTIDSDRETIISAQKQNDFLTENKSKRINELEKSIEDAKIKVKEYEKAIQKLKDLKLTYDENKVVIDKVDSDISEKEELIKVAERKKIGFEHLKNNSIICENCEHENIPGDYSEEDYKKQISIIETLEKEIENLIENSVDIKQKNDKIYEALLNSKRIAQNKKDIETSITQKQKELEEVNKWQVIEVDKSGLKQKETELKNIKETLSETENKLSSLVKLMTIIGGDNLKGYILSKQIPFLNKYINTFIEKFSDFEFNFVLDNNFNEQFISRNEQQEFNSFSNGQKQRFTFAILFAFLKLIEERNGISTNILILDEILDSSADSQGRAELLDILYNEFSPNKNIMIITHNDEIRERADIICRNFSVVNDGFAKLVNNES